MDIDIKKIILGILKLLSWVWIGMSSIALTSFLFDNSGNFFGQIVVVVIITLPASGFLIWRHKSESSVRKFIKNEKRKKSEANYSNKKRIIKFKNMNTGELRDAPFGFSFTTLFFAFIPSLLRGDFKWLLIQILLIPITFSISLIIFPFIYNKLYIKELLGKGFIAVRNEDNQFLINQGFISNTYITRDQSVNPYNTKQAIPQQLIEFKNLLDLGIINEEEYEKKKKELLSF